MSDKTEKRRSASAKHCSKKSTGANKQRSASNASEKVPRLTLTNRGATHACSSLSSAGSASGASSGSSARHSPKSLYVPYGDSGDLMNELAPDFDPLKPPTLCFQCGQEHAPESLTLTTERTGYRFQQATDIYRPVYSCAQCLSALAEQKALNARYIVKLDKSVLSFYA